MEILTILIRFAVVFTLAFIFGMERQRSHKPIGFGTYIFVSVGSCALAIISEILSQDNPLSLLSAIVTGIGFLGAGALIKTTDKVFGFTTAASIWIFAIFGLAIGVGEYTIGGIIYALMWFVIFYDIYMEFKGIGSYQRKLIVYTNQIIHEKEITDIFALSHIGKYKSIGTEVDKKNARIIKTYSIEGKKEEINKIPQALFKKEWFESCKIE
jgi:putative Mg2+ transporter-C (MgtC) family protein